MPSLALLLCLFAQYYQINPFIIFSIQSTLAILLCPCCFRSNIIWSWCRYFMLLTLKIHRFIGLVGRVFANGLGHLGSIPGRVTPKTLKMVLDTSLLNAQQYKVCIKGKVEQFKEGVAPSPTSRCSSYWKGSLLAALDYGHQLYFHLRFSFSQQISLSY